MAAEDTDELDRLRGALDDARHQAEHDRATIKALRDAADEQRRETQRQVRNILSVVRSIARRTAAEGETAEEYQLRLDSRLASFTRLQAHVLRDPLAGVDLCTLVSDELLTFGLGEGAQARVEGPVACLQPKAASVLGLAFHELACMAVNGGLARGDVHVEVRWRFEANRGGPGHLWIEWTQTERQARSGSEPHAPFGREYLEEAVTYELGGEVRLDSTDRDLTCRFRLPVDGLLAVKQDRLSIESSGIS